MVWLWLLIGFGVFLVLCNWKNQKSCWHVQNTCQRVSRDADFWQRVQLISVVVLAFPLHHWIRLDILYLSGWHVYSDSVRFSWKWLFFSCFFLFLLFLPRSVWMPYKKSNQPFNWIFLSIQSIFFYLYFFINVGCF